MGKLLGSFIFVVLTSLVALFIYEYVGEETTPPSRSKAEIFGPRSQAQASNKSQIDQAVQVVKDLCLAGKQYDLHVDAKGNIVIKKFIPGAEGSVTISEREATGHTPTYDEKLRIIADAQVRSCTKEHIPDILKATLSSQQSSSTPHGDIKKPPPTDGNLLSELREDQPGWAIKKESNYNLVNSQLSAQGLFTASAGDSSWDNYVVEFDVKKLVTSARFEFGVLIRRQRDTNYVGLQLKHFVHWHPCYARWVVAREGRETVIVGSEMRYDCADQTVHYRIEVDGNKYKLFKDGSQMFVFNNNTFANGGVGLKSVNRNVTFTIDNFKVVRLRQ